MQTDIMKIFPASRPLRSRKSMLESEDLGVLRFVTTGLLCTTIMSLVATSACCIDICESVCTMSTCMALHCHSNCKASCNFQVRMHVQTNCRESVVVSRTNAQHFEQSESLADRVIFNILNPRTMSNFSDVCEEHNKSCTSTCAVP